MIETYIAELLYKFDTVILPGFGAFILKSIPAKVQIVENKISPPVKIITFNPSIINNDGILANYLSDKNRISFIEANHQILSFVNEINKTLIEKKEIIFPKIGRFSLSSINAEKAFHPDTSVNYNPDTCLLNEIIAKPIIRDEVKIKLQQQFSKGTNTPKKQINFLKVALWILLFIFLTGASIIYLQVYKTSEKKSGLSIALKEKNTIIKFSKLPISKDTSEQSNIVLTTSTGDKYYIISGSFKIKENAEKFANVLKKKEYNPEVIYISEEALYAVSYYSFKSKEEALKQLSKINLYENKDAWILNY